MAAIIVLSNEHRHKIKVLVAKNRLLATDLTLLFAQVRRGSIDVNELVRESDRLSEQIRTWEENLDAVFWDESYLVEVLKAGYAVQRTLSIPPSLMASIGALFAFNFMLIDWRTFDLIQKYKRASTLRQPLPSEPRALTLELCRLFEAIELGQRVLRRALWRLRVASLLQSYSYQRKKDTLYGADRNWLRQRA